MSILCNHPKDSELRLYWVIHIHRCLTVLSCADNSSYPRHTGSRGLWHALIRHAGLAHIIHRRLFVEEFPGSAQKTVKAQMH